MMRAQNTFQDAEHFSCLANQSFYDYEHIAYYDYDYYYYYYYYYYIMILL